MGLLTDLDAFFTDHHDCGDLDADVDGPIVCIVCVCGASIGAPSGAVDCIRSDPRG
jgi:hypothetical protein